MANDRAVRFLEQHPRLFPFDGVGFANIDCNPPVCMSRINSLLFSQ